MEMLNQGCSKMVKSVFHAGGGLPANCLTYVERQADRDALQAVLRNDYLNVIAPRQEGKTSLLLHLATRLSKMGWRVAYVDLSSLIDFPKSEWYTALGRVLASSLTPGNVPEITNQITMHYYLLEQALPWPKGLPRIVIIFDEVEGAVKTGILNERPFSDSFFMALRSLYTKRYDFDGNLVVALAGAMSPNELVTDLEISPFNVGQSIGLDYFSATENEFLTQYLTRLNVQVDALVHNTIYSWTEGHPYLTQRICAELEKKAQNGNNSVITSEDVNVIVKQSILSPTNLPQDSNLRYVSRKLSQLSGAASRLWEQIQNGKTVSRDEVDDGIYLKLYLTGAIKTEKGYIVISNPIYKKAYIVKTYDNPRRNINVRTEESLQEPIVYEDDQNARIMTSTENLSSELYRIILKRFNLEELRTLCFNLGIEYDDLGGDGRASKARELVEFMQRSDQLSRLSTIIKTMF